MARGGERRRAGRAVARKVGAYELSPREKESGRRGRSYDKRRKRKTAKERVPFIQRSRRKRQRRGTGTGTQGRDGGGGGGDVAVG